MLESAKRLAGRAGDRVHYKEPKAPVPGGEHAFPASVATKKQLWRALVYRPEGCEVLRGEGEVMPPMTMLAYVYAAVEVGKQARQRMARVVYGKAVLFHRLDQVLMDRRCHPTDFMRAQFAAWREKRGFHDKKRGVFVQMDYPPPEFLCPRHDRDDGLEASTGWQRAWATYEAWARERLPFGPKFRDPAKLLDLDVRTAHVRSAKLRRDFEGAMPEMRLSSFATAAGLRRADFARIRKGEATVRDFEKSDDRFERWDWRTIALVEHAGLATRRLRTGDDRFSRLIRHAHAFLKTEQPSRDWLRRALHPLKIPPCPSSASASTPS